MSHLVLLGNDWNGVPSFQCLPPTILSERWEGEHSTYAEQNRVPQLCYHIDRWSSRIIHCRLHRRRQIHRSQVHHCNLHLDNRHSPLLLHYQQRFEFSAYLRQP